MYITSREDRSVVLLKDIFLYFKRAPGRFLLCLNISISNIFQLVAEGRKKERFSAACTDLLVTIYLPVRCVTFFYKN